jgi:DNA-binding GntR family transcriptional regulator
MKQGPKLQPIDTTTMHERCYQELRTGLMAGVYKPGDTVTLRGVAEVLGTSLTPVREAVRRLVSERALEMPNSRSVRVQLMTLKVFDDLIGLRLVLEPMAVRLTAANIDNATVDLLASINADIMGNIEAKNIQAAMSINRRFHQILYDASGNDALIGVIDTLWTQSGPYINLLLSNISQADMLKLFRVHDELIINLRDRAADAAAATTVKIISPSTSLYRSQIGRFSAG